MALRHKDGHVDKGVSLARVPALVLGSILLTFGLLAFLQNGDTPTGGWTDGTVNGESFLGLEVNGWTAFFTSVAGGLLLFGAAQHLLAKTMSLLVGLALGACSVIALVDGDDVLGLAAANGWTKLGWGVAAAFLLVNTLLPRRGGKDHDRHEHVREPVVAPRGTRRETVATDRDVESGRAPVGTTDRPRVDDTQATRVEEPEVQRTGRFDRDERTPAGDEGSVSEERPRR
jgi:hypothetical protein